MAIATNYYNWIIEEYGRFVKGKVVVEVGAGSGNFSNYILLQRPKQLYVIEPSKMAKILEDCLANTRNVTFINDFLKGKAEDLKGKVDTMFYINVLEHVEKDAEELKLAFDSLKPGGHLCIYVPAHNQLYGSFDEKVGHYRRYSKKGLRRLLEEAGFEIEKINYSDIVGILPWIVSFKILKTKHLSPNSVLVYDKLVIPLIRLQEKIFKPPVGKNLWALAQKPQKARLKNIK